MSALMGTVVAAAALIAASPATSAAHPSHAARADSVTGCLRKGDKPNVFTLKAQDGKTLWVTSETVSLAGHVGHTVTLSGNVQSESTGSIADSSKMAGMSDSMKMDSSKTSGSVMQVTKLSMVSGTCR